MTVTKRESAPLPERLCEQITYSTAMFAMWVNFSDKFVQCEGADHRFYSTPEMQNILLQNAVGHAVRKAKNFAGGVTDAILSGRQVLINLMSDFVLDKTKATAKGRQWVLRQIKLERITNNATFAAGGQSVRFTPMTLGLTEGHYGECAGLLVGYQPLGSIPRRFSSARPNSLSQLARLMPSLCASLSNCSFSSGEIRILNCGDCPSPLGLLSRLIVDKWSPIELAFLLLGGHLNTGTLKKAKPEGARNTNGLLTTNDSNSIEVAMLNHTTHPQGRDSHNLNKYIWRFIALSTAQPRVITIEATSEQEARQQSPAGCVMVFAARIRQEVHHA
ncbi:TPA: host cell division inhibitor Icd-like protein [Escherichia coli]|nr:host cell division inhibitor Icd-like protein [Escherichia coli]HAO2835075.1 host cell division inhibitor Icd-like protein [Escherichia coli]